MTPLQILRTTVMDGTTLTLYRRADGYHIELKGMNAAGQTTCCEVVHPRLEQALFAMVERMSVGREMLRAG